jgi:cytochrome c oxidase assembly protein Cox11
MSSHRTLAIVYKSTHASVFSTEWAAGIAVPYYRIFCERSCGTALRRRVN